ncbi:MAG: hypothetical protein Q8N39_06105 [Pelolinea sp.]|nr:hypothetical protein [Pelolinea sp.]
MTLEIDVLLSMQFYKEENMGIFKSSQISLDQIDGYITNLTNHPLLIYYYSKWGEFVESNPNLWIKEKTELDMLFNINLDSISISLESIINSSDRKKLDEKINICNKISVYYSCLIGVGFSFINKIALASCNLLPNDIKDVFAITYIPSYELFELIFHAHYKNNPHMAFQRDEHLADTKRGIIRRTETACLEGSNAATKLNFEIF